MSDETTPEIPSENFSDEDLSTSREDMETQPEIEPEIAEDFGMPVGDSATLEEAISLDPGELPEEVGLPAEMTREEILEFSPEAFVLSGPGSGTAPKPGQTLEASDQLVSTLITREALKNLWLRADRAQELVREQVKALGIARELLDMIQAARNQILAGKDHYEEAERFINEVEFRVDLSSKMGEWTKTYGIPLFIYEVFWGVVSFGFLFFWMDRVGDSFFLENNSDFVYFMGCMMWGGIGGVIGALISLVKHIAIDQDFDRQHVMWYIGSPIVGYGVGAVIFLILRAGLLSLTGPNQAITSPFIMYAIAWLSGYQHNVFTDMLKRVLKIFSQDNGEK